MAATSIAAANAYSALARLTESGAAKTGGDTGGFGNVLKEALGSLAEVTKKSDTQSQALAAGKANMLDVVTAVAETEVAIDAVVSVRDRVIQAYEEIMKMPI